MYNYRISRCEIVETYMYCTSTGTVGQIRIRSKKVAPLGTIDYLLGRITALSLKLFYPEWLKAYLFKFSNPTLSKFSF